MAIPRAVKRRIGVQGFVASFLRFILSTLLRNRRKIASEKPTVTFVVILGHITFAMIATGTYAIIVLMKKRAA